MYKVRYLTPEELAIIDPYYYGRDKIKSYKEGIAVPTPLIFKKIDINDLYEDYLARFTCRYGAISKVKPFVEFEVSQRKAWGPQGISFPLQTMQEILTPYYTQAYDSREFRLVTLGRDYLIARIRERISRQGFNMIAQEETGLPNTTASLPYGGHKNEYYPNTVGKCPIFKLWPDLPGQRHMRNKPRVIHMDPLANVRLWQRELSAIREWLKQEFPEYFASWSNPTSALQPAITSALSRRATFVEGDYEKCDSHFSLQLVQEVVLPIYESFFLPSTFIQFADYVEALFNQTVFWGDYVWEGLHNLFSGQVITNDFETVYDICLQLGIAISVSLHDLLVVQALGDDMLMGFKTPKYAERARSLLVEEANRNGMLMHPDKCRLVTGETRYLRRVYYPGGPTVISKTGESILPGAYPVVLTLNNVFNPEFYNGDPVLDFIATFMRLDNLVGTPDHTYWVQMVGSKLKPPLYAIEEYFSEDKIAALSTKDWWTKLYGEVWSHRTSPSVKIFMKSFPNYFTL